MLCHPDAKINHLFMLLFLKIIEIKFWSIIEHHFWSTNVFERGTAAALGSGLVWISRFIWSTTKKVESNLKGWKWNFLWFQDPPCFIIENENSDPKIQNRQSKIYHKNKTKCFEYHWSYCMTLESCMFLIS